ALELRGVTTVVRSSAERFLRRPPRESSASAYGLVLIDPPFAAPDVFEPLTEALVEGWLAPEALVVCERERIRGASPPVAWPRALRLEAERVYGQVVVEFLRHVG